MTDLKFLKRNVEILLNDEYRCIIDPNEGYFIQRKQNHKVEEVFVSEISTLECIYYSHESPIIRDAHFVINPITENILGLASFLECRNVSVKTTYLDDNEGTVLYQRIVLDDYKTQHYFILEHKFCNKKRRRNLESLKRYFAISYIFSRKMLSSSSSSSNKINKPIHSLLFNDNSDYIYF